MAETHLFSLDSALLDARSKHNAADALTRLVASESEPAADLVPA